MEHIKLKEKLISFKPFDEEEAKDLKSFIEFLDEFQDNVWTRDNEVGHISSSAWVVNKERTKVLMAYHNIYDSFAWLGGHADGDKDLLYVALKETGEESGLKNIKPILEEFFDVTAGVVEEHVRKGKVVPTHKHYNVTYLIEGDENESLQIAEEENSALKWIEFDDISKLVKEEHMKPIYQRLTEKVKLTR